MNSEDKKINFLSLISSLVRLFRHNPNIYLELLWIAFISLIFAFIVHGIAMIIISLGLGIFPIMAGMLGILLHKGTVVDTNHVLGTVPALLDYATTFTVLKSILNAFINNFPIAIFVSCFYSSSYQRNIYGTTTSSELKHSFKLYFKSLRLCLQYWLMPLFIMIPICCFMPRIVSVIIGSLLILFATILTIKGLLRLLPASYLIFQGGITDEKELEKKIKEIPYKIGALIYLYPVALCGIFHLCNFLATSIFFDPLSLLKELGDLGKWLLTPELWIYFLVLFLLHFLLTPLYAAMPCIYFDLLSRNDFKVNQSFDKVSMISFITLALIPIVTVSIGVYRLISILTAIAPASS